MTDTLHVEGTQTPDGATFRIWFDDGSSTFTVAETLRWDDASAVLADYGVERRTRNWLLSRGLSLGHATRIIS